MAIVYEIMHKDRRVALIDDTAKCNFLRKHLV